MKRTFVIGDLHGCYREAMDLLERVGATSEDRIIFCGDLIDRGPENAKCVDLAMKHECILGNHEEKHLFYRAQEERGKNPNVVAPTHVATRLELKDEHYEYFKQLPLFIRLPEFNAVVVHAGVWPNVPIEHQDSHHLLHCQMINPHYDRDGRITKRSMWPSKAPADWKFWTHFWTGPEVIIFGHSVLDRPLLTEKAIGIDGGAVFGRELWALELSADPERSGGVHRVKSQTNADKGRRGRNDATGNPIGFYKIHGDVGTFS